MDLGTTSLMLIYGAMAAYAVAMIAFGIDLGKAGATRAANIGMTVTYTAFALHLAGVVTRGIAGARVPWANMYEFTITASCVATATFLYTMRRNYMRGVGAILTLVVLLSLGIAVAVLYIQVAGTPPILDTYWLVIHVSTATIASGLFGFAALLSVLQLVQSRRQAKTPAASVAAAGGGGGVAVAEKEERTEPSLPPAATFEQRAFTVTVIGFLLWTFTLIAGAIWAEHSWGRPWNWDPKETMSLVVWFVYAAYLHTRTTRGWSGNRAAYLCLAGFAALMINYFGINLFVDSIHSYSGV